MLLRCIKGYMDFLEDEYYELDYVLVKNYMCGVVEDRTGYQAYLRKQPTGEWWWDQGHAVFVEVH